MSVPVRAENLGFAYAGVPVFKGVDFSVRDGEFVALIGANGSGKSTLLKLILGELLPSSGRVSLFGTESEKFRDWQKIGYASQTGFAGAAGFPASVGEIVTAGLYGQIGPFRLPGRSHREAARRALGLVGMEDLEKRLIGELSGGQMQRVMLARALVAGPSLLMLDEPTAGLDTESAQMLYDLLSGLFQRSGAAVLMVTHDIARAAQIADRVLCLEEQTLVELSKEQLRRELSVRHSHGGCVCEPGEEDRHGHI